MVSEQPYWGACSQDDCIGIQLPTTAWCLVHAAEQAPDAFEAELKRIGAEGTVDARGVPVSAELLARLVDALPRRYERPAFKAARFDRASFHGEVGFGGVIFYDWAVFEGAIFKDFAGFPETTFMSEARFTGASFQGGAGFEGATCWGPARFDEAGFHGEVAFTEASFSVVDFDQASFEGEVWFIEASFNDWAEFRRADFHGKAQFDRAFFKRDTRFDGASFQGEARFDEATFQGNAGFGGATFQQEASFDRATFHGDAWFDQATFERDAWFGGMVCRQEARFVRARFERARQLGPLLVYGVLRLDAAHFAQLVQVEASARGLSCQRTRFPAGVRFELRGAQVVLDGADLPSPSLLTGIAGLSDARLARREQRLVQAIERLVLLLGSSWVNVMLLRRVAVSRRVAGAGRPGRRW